MSSHRKHNSEIPFLTNAISNVSNITSTNMERTRDDSMKKSGQNNTFTTF